MWVKIQNTIWQCSGLCVRQHSFGLVVQTPPSSKTSWTSRWPLGTLGSDQVKRPNAEPCAELWDTVFTSVCQKYEKGEFTHIDLYNWGQKFQSLEISPEFNYCPWFCLSTCLHMVLFVVQKTGSACSTQTSVCSAEVITLHPAS